MTNKPNHKSKKPLSTLRDGAISASVWQNESENGKSFYAVTFSRLYTDAAGNMQNTASFSGTDLLKLSQLAQQAYQAARQLAADNSHDDEGPHDEPGMSPGF